jgi:hypothetical protein
MNHLKCCRLLVVALVAAAWSGANSAPAEQPPPSVNALGIVGQVMERFDEYLGAKALSSFHNEELLTDSAVSTLLSEEKKTATGGKAETLLSFARAVADLHEAGDRFDQPACEAALKKVKQLFSAMEQLYPSDVLNAARSLASRYCCPMHSDFAGKKADLCAKCGMPLDAQVRLSPFVLPEGARPAPVVQARIEMDAPLKRQEKVTGRLKLASRTGDAILLSDLREVHTQKIHLLIVDTSLTDYHHEHPQPTAVPGEYAFSFTPTKPGPYRAWADIQPYLTGIQEYARVEIPAGTNGEALPNTIPRLTAVADGLRYEIQFDSELKANQPAAGELHITRADGSPCRELEPTMGAFAHVVAFHQDRATVLHIHPQGSGALAPTDRGGPILRFQFYAPKAGFYRLFSKVQLGGEQKFAPFGIRVGL